MPSQDKRVKSGWRKRTIQLHERIERVVLRVIPRTMSILTTQRPRLKVGAGLQLWRLFNLWTELHFRAPR